MARGKVRSRREVVERVGALGAALADGLERRAAGSRDAQVVDALWEAEGLGVLMWALELATLPAFDRSFDPETLLVATGRRGRAALRDRAR